MPGAKHFTAGMSRGRRSSAGRDWAKRKRLGMKLLKVSEIFPLVNGAVRRRSTAVSQTSRSNVAWHEPVDCSFSVETATRCGWLSVQPRSERVRLARRAKATN